MAETVPEDNFEPEFSDPRAKALYEAMIEVLCDLDDPLTLAETWAEEVARLQAAAWAVIDLEGGVKLIPMGNPDDPEEWGPWQYLLALLQKSPIAPTQEDQKNG